MKPKGTLFMLDGTQYSLMSMDIVNGLYQIIAEPKVDAPPGIDSETHKLLENIFYTKNSRVETSKLIVDWFLVCKGKLQQNSKLLMSINRDVFAAELRRVFRSGESWHDIIDTLAFTLEDQFWSQKLLPCYRNISKPTANSDTPIYNRIRDRILELRKDHSQQIFDGTDDL